MDLALSAEQEELRRTVRAWVEDVVAPRAIENDRAERFPSEALEGLKELGLIGLTIPEEYDGGGADPFSYVLAVEELARGDANVRSILSVHLGLVASPLARWGTDEQKQRWLPAMARARRSAASASPSRTPAPTRPACVPARNAPAAAGGSTAARSSSPTAPSPASR